MRPPPFLIQRVLLWVTHVEADVLLLAPLRRSLLSQPGTQIYL